MTIASPQATQDEGERDRLVLAISEGIAATEDDFCIPSGMIGRIADHILAAGYSRRTEATGEAIDAAKAVIKAYGEDYVRSGAVARHEARIADALTAYARAAEERAIERCAKVADAVAGLDMHGARFRSYPEVAQYIATAIRALRGQSADGKE